MTKQLLYVLLLITGIAGAQTINIPDANFKARLLLANTTNMIAQNSANQNIKIDANNDGEIQQSEALLVYKLRLHNTIITSLAGLEHFNNLIHLECNNNQLPSINLTGLSNLTQLQVINNNLVSIDLSPSPNITFLYCSNNNLSSLDVSMLQSLVTLFCSGNELTELDLSGISTITNLSCSGNQLAELDLSSLNQLHSLDCGDNPISQLDLSGLFLLEQVSINNPLTILNTNGLESLEVIFIENSLLTEVDLNDSPALKYFHIDNNSLLTSINLNNGGSILYALECSLTNNPLLNFICIDEGEDLVLLEYFEHYNITPVPMDSNCGGSQPEEYNNINGVITFDLDGDGCDENDVPGSYVQITLSDGVMSRSKYTYQSGNYLFFTEAGNYTVTPSSPNSLFTFNPLSASVTFDEMNGSASIQNFCLTANGVHPDVEVIIMPLTIANPGFNALYKVVFRNKGNQVLSGDVTLNYNDAVLDYVMATPAEASSVPGVLSWSYSGLMPFEDRTILVTLNLNGPTETPPLVTGDMLALTATVTSTGGDDNPEDNTFTFDQMVSGSFDPNNIICLEGDTEAPEAIGDYLHYVINFENIEETPATFVVVTNEIDPEQYDISTLEILNSSHQVETTVTGNVVEFRFDDINLGPDVYGNVTYKVKSRANLEIGDAVTNGAVIVFDFNEPLATNDAVTTFTALSTQEFSANAALKIYPNPSSGIVNIKADTAVETIDLYDIQGRLLQFSVINAAEATLDISKRAAGIYFIKVQTERGITVEKIVRQ